MKENVKALVTMAIGGRYLADWKKFCEPGWRRYADRFGYDLIVSEEPFDDSERARKRNPSWQKCLSASREFSPRYERIVWLDADIMINPIAPDITADVPEEKVGAAPVTFFHRAHLTRCFKIWPTSVFHTSVAEYTPREYYRDYGLPGDVDKVIEGGVLVLSPRFHRSLLEHVYYDYEEKEGGGREWHMEMRPLSYELYNAGMVVELDPRFNVLWPMEEILRYPFLLDPPANTRRGLLAAVRAKIERKLRPRLLHGLRATCLNAVYQSSYFCHFTGMKTDEMAMIKTKPTAWWDVICDS